MQTIHLVVTGRVQGVGYRYATRKCARKLNLEGWVKNLENGDVEIKARGSHPNIQIFIEWCHRGPRAATVTKVRELTQDDSDDFAVPFEIRYT